MNIKQYLNKEIIFVVLINLLGANIIFSGPIIVLIAVIIASAFSYDPDRALTVAVFTFLAIILLRLLVLPIAYGKLERKSKNEIIQKFIHNLKNNNKFRLKFLLFTELPVFLYIIFISIINIKDYLEDHNFNFSHMDANSYLIGDLKEICIAILIIMFCFDLFGSYLVLFLWWKIRGELK